MQHAMTSHRYPQQQPIQPYTQGSGPRLHRVSLGRTTATSTDKNTILPTSDFNRIKKKSTAMLHQGLQDRYHSSNPVNLVPSQNMECSYHRHSTVVDNAKAFFRRNLLQLGTKQRAVGKEERESRPTERKSRKGI